MSRLQGEVVESDSPQGEGPGQKTHMCEQNADGILKCGQFLEDRRGFNQLPVSLRLLDLEKSRKWHLGVKRFNLLKM